MMPALSTRKRRVLIVEDNVDIRESLKQLLECEGYIVDIAADGWQGVRQLRAAAPDLILLDIMMPVMDGYEFRAQQQSDPMVAAIPVVVLSADGNVDEKKRRLSAHDYLRKPIDLDVLLDAVKKYCLYD